MCKERCPECKCILNKFPKTGIAICLNCDYVRGGDELLNYSGHEHKNPKRTLRSIKSERSKKAWGQRK